LRWVLTDLPILGSSSVNGELRALQVLKDCVAKLIGLLFLHEVFFCVFEETLVLYQFLHVLHFLGAGVRSRH